MPIFPGPVSHNNPNAPILKLGENQVKGMGIFVDIITNPTGRDFLPSSLRLEGYVAVVKSTDKTYIYTSASILDNDWKSTDNWVVQGNDSTYEHLANESTAASEWVVDHNLGKYPGVTVLDTDNDHIEGYELIYVNLNQLKLKFYQAGVAASVAGKAYVN